MGIQNGMSTPIILCADDYGVTREIGQGIRELVEKRRLSAVSCISESPEWPAEAAQLEPLSALVDVGLHFNMTLSFPQRQKSRLGAWLGRSLCGLVDAGLVKDELSKQLDLFEAAWERPPDFVDGHQHVHVFPGVRKPFLAILAERYPIEKRPWIRAPIPPLRGHDAVSKALVLQVLGRGFVRDLQAAGFQYPNSFSGLYSLGNNANYPELMAGWLSRARSHELLMCHPGISERNDPDGIGPVRVREYEYLQSDDFLTLCEKEKIYLTKLPFIPNLPSSG